MSSLSTRQFVVGLVVATIAIAMIVSSFDRRRSPETASTSAHAERPRNERDGWSSIVAARLRAGESSFRGHEDGYRSRHRGQAMTATFDATGRARFARDDGQAVDLNLVSVGRRERTRSVARAVAPGACRRGGEIDVRGECVRRLELDRGDGVVEWWENRDEGFEHGLDVTHRPGGDGPLAFEVAIDADVTIDPDDRGATLGTGFRYAGLFARDARGTTLPSWFEPSEQGLAMRVDDRDAAYPIVVDPVVSSIASFVSQGGAQDDALGTSVAFAGDVDADGFSDVLVGAPGVDDGEADEGAVYLFRGGPGGLTTVAAETLTPDVVGARFGSSVASAGDVNGDGFADVLVGAPGYSNGESAEGAVYVFLGDAGGLVSPPTILESNQVGAALGSSVAGAGDVDGDGFSDVLVGAPAYDDGESNEGIVWLVPGSGSGVDDAATVVLAIDEANASFGSAVATAGDVDGDGFSDVIVGAPDHDGGESGEGAAYLFLGGAGGLSTSPGATVESDQVDAHAGRSVSTAGDVDGDGFADVLVGAPDFDAGQSNEGAVLLRRGSVTGLSAAGTRVEANQANSHFGASVALAGDVNGDGFADVVVGAPDYGAGQVGEGRGFVFLGRRAGLEPTAAATFEPDQASASFGAAVTSAGDVDGDGFSEVLFGAPRFDGSATDLGSVSLYRGSGAAPSTSVGARVAIDQTDSSFGTSVASAGDVNGDGYADVIVGAATYDGGEIDEGRALVFLGSANGLATTPTWSVESDQAGARFGRSVASAGDVNGDGFGDVVVGASLYDRGEVDEGRAFVFLGSSGGLGASPVWSAESNQAGAQFGISVAGAGDLNGDGYGDVVVGAPNFANGQTAEGRAYVYLGTSKGLRATPGFVFEVDKVNSNFGSSVAGAGDVDGDGFGDLIVGARNYDADQIDEGRAYLYRGSASGPLAAGVWSAESDQDAAGFGTSVAGAGDVDGDGYDDVIIGAPRFDAGQVDEGRVYLFHGSATGLATSANATIDGDEAGAAFGASVMGAGDVDGDGLSDVVVGMPFHGAGLDEQGRAVIHLGTSTGIAPVAAFVRDSAAIGAQLGTSVAGAGDVNGDGFADVVIGAPRMSDGQVNEGVADVHFGDGNATGASVGRRLRLVDGYSTTPVSPGGRLDALDLDVSVLGSTPIGRARVRLELELVSGIAPFSGAATAASATFAPGSLVGVPATLPLDAGALAPSSRYHLRARLRVSPVHASPFVTTHVVFAGRSGSPRGTHVRTSSGDADGDGYGALGFGGTDCDDDELEVNPAAADTACDGIDKNCSGVADEGFSPSTTTCGTGACARTGSTTCAAGVQGDTCVAGPPAADDATCDGIDDDCSGAEDEDFALVATVCGVGACRATGSTQCVGGVATDTCAPGTPAADDATCDGLDDDCSGSSDEDFAPSATTCGVGACADTGTTSCVGGDVLDSCSPGAPAANDETCDGLDDDCSGVADEDFVPHPTSCGVGSCVRGGTATCALGAELDSCVPGVPAGLDATCNGLDEDCSGVADDDFVPATTQCGLGACREFGATACSAGSVEDTCVPGSPAANDATCDGVDDDCSGRADEDGMCSAIDAGPAHDASVPRDAGPRDAGRDEDGGATPPRSGDDGCSCTVAGARSATPSLLAFAALAITLATRRAAARNSRKEPS